VGRGGDDTLFAKEHGTVHFTRSRGNRRFVHVVPEPEEA
jgi:large subunit ribosomal protein L27